MGVPFSLAAALIFGGIGVSHAQVIPTTPTKFTTRELGNRGTGNSSIDAMPDCKENAFAPAAPDTVRTGTDGGE